MTINDISCNTINGTLGSDMLADYYKIIWEQNIKEITFIVYYYQFSNFFFNALKRFLKSMSHYKFEDFMFLLKLTSVPK